MSEFFNRLYGNEKTKKRIGDAIRRGTLPHAFLIDGDEGSGKATLAIEIASALNCERRNEQSSPSPCGKCDSCRRIYEGGFVDVKILKRSKDKATIGVSEIKDLRTDMFLSPTESNYKIYIIDDAQTLTPEAQNALLIVLEEPPKNVIIMLLAQGVDKILTTIKSRTQYIAMSRFTTAEIRDYLHQNRMGGFTVADEEKLLTASVAANGSIGQAIDLLKPAKANEEKQRRDQIVDFLRLLKKRTPYSSMYAYQTSMPPKRTELSELLVGIMSALGDLIVLKNASDPPLCFFETREKALEICEGIAQSKLLRIYDAVNEAQEECSKNANVNALLTKLFAHIRIII